MQRRNSNSDENIKMKKIAFILFAYLSSIGTYAQQVWTEGTVWETTIDGYHLVHRLDSPVEIEGVTYFPIIVKEGSLEFLRGYIRSEKGDSLVFYRYADEFGISEQENMIYDFTKCFECGDFLRYGTKDQFFEELIECGEDEMIYYHDIFEEGDVIPQWHGFIYKIGNIEGPIWFETHLETTGPNNPNASNLSHLVFTTKGGHHLEHVPDSLELILVDDTLTEDEAYYAADGRRLKDKPVRGIYIHKGRKYIIIY